MGQLARRIRATATLLGLVPVALAQWGVRAGFEPQGSTVLLVLSALGVAVLAAGRPVDCPARTVSPPVSAGIWPGPVWLGTCLLVAAAVGLAAAWRTLFAIDVLLLVAGVWLVSRGLRRADGAGPATLPWTRADAVLVGGIVALALVLRLVGFTAFPDPYGIFAIEEPQTGVGGALILRGYRPWEFLLDHYLAAAALLLGGPSLPAVRLPFAIVSALTVVPLYALLRQLVSRDAAGFGTLLLAVSGWHLSYARCAHNIFLPTFVVVLVLALLVHGERTHRLGVYPWAGLLVATTVFSYAGYRGTVVFVVLFFATTLVEHWRRGRRARTEAARAAEVARGRRDLRGALWLGLVVAAVIPALVVRLHFDPRPGYSYFEAAQRSLANREYYTADVAELVRLRALRLRDAAAIFVHYGDDSPTFNVPGDPMLDPVTAAFALCGFLYALCFPLRQHNGFLVFMTVALFVGGTVFVQNLDVRRLQGVIPLVCLFAALCADRLIASARAFGARGVWFARVALGACALVAGAVNAYGFFGKLWHDPEVRRAFLNEEMEMIRLARTRLAGRYVVLVSDRSNFFGSSDYEWLVTPITGQLLDDVATLWTVPSPPDSAGKPISIVIAPPFDVEAIGRFVQRLYPEAMCWRAVNPDAPDLAMQVCDLPAGAMRAAQLPLFLHGRYTVGDAGEVVERAEPFVAEALFPPVCRSRTERAEVEDCTAEWTGTFTLGAPAVVEWLPQAQRGHLEVLVDGAPATGPLALSAGAHRLRAQARFPRDERNGLALQWKVDGGAATLVPFYDRGGADRPSKGVPVTTALLQLLALPPSTHGHNYGDVFRTTHFRSPRVAPFSQGRIEGPV